MKINPVNKSDVINSFKGDGINEPFDIELIRIFVSGGIELELMYYEFDLDNGKSELTYNERVNSAKLHTLALMCIK